MLKRNGPDVEIKLIDYDSLFVHLISFKDYPDNHCEGFQNINTIETVATGG